jgi:flagellar assembly factor FliW
MNVQTTRFGDVEIDESRIINFPAGLLGFSNFKRYALLQPDDEGIFFWLQSVDAPELAFVVTDPCLWVSEYQAQIRKEQMEQLHLASIDDAQVFVIVNKYDQTLTANLQGPLVINVASRDATQLVLADKRWTTRHEIVDIGAPLQAASA